MAKRKRNSSNSSDEDVSETKANTRVSSDSSSSSDGEDGDWNAKKSNKSKAKGRGRPVKKSAKQVVDEEEREEGEVEDDDEEDIEEFNDGYDDNLMGDEDDQKRLALMTEKEREQELFNRSEKREVLKTRFEIEKKLRMAKKKEQNKTQTDASQRSTERRRNLEDKRKVKDAIKGLKEMREKKKEKLKQQRLRAADVYSSDSDSDEDKNAGRKSSSSSSSTSSSSDDSDEEKPKIRSEDNNKKEEDDWDDTHNSDREEEVEAWTLTIEHLNQIKLSRHKMEKWCHSPFFKETITGCFVRIGIGVNPKTKTNTYIVAQIVDVTETPKIYNLGKTRTNKGIKLRHARQSERVYRLEFVSDGVFSPQEYQKWCENMEKDRCELPSREFFERKKRDIMNAMNFHYTDNDIESIVQEKERFSNRPVNFAMKKTRLMKDKELAELNGDNDKVERIVQELDELESEAKKLDKKRTQNIAAISYINERNRMRNIQESEKALVEESAVNKLLQKDDPFTRRKCTPTMIHMFNKNKTINNIKTDLDSVSNDLEEKIELNLKNDSIEENNNKELTTGDQNYGLDSEPKPLVPNERPLSPGHQNDLFSAHNFDIKIDFDVDIGIPSASSANSFSNSTFTTNNNSYIAPKPTNRRSLNLDEYKKKKGLI